MEFLTDSAEPIFSESRELLRRAGELVEQGVSEDLVERSSVMSNIIKGFGVFREYFSKKGNDEFYNAITSKEDRDILRGICFKNGIYEIWPEESYLRDEINRSDISTFAKFVLLVIKRCGNDINKEIGDDRDEDVEFVKGLTLIFLNHILSFLPDDTLSKSRDYNLITKALIWGASFIIGKDMLVGDRQTDYIKAIGSALEKKISSSDGEKGWLISGCLVEGLMRTRELFSVNEKFIGRRGSSNNVEQPLLEREFDPSSEKITEYLVDLFRTVFWAMKAVLILDKIKETSIASGGEREEKENVGLNMNNAPKLGASGCSKSPDEGKSSEKKLPRSNSILNEMKPPEQVVSAAVVGGPS